MYNGVYAHNKCIHPGINTILQTWALYYGRGGKEKGRPMFQINIGSTVMKGKIDWVH